MRVYKTVKHGGNNYNYLAERNLTSLTLNELLGYREIIPEKLGVLPNSLPYRVVEKKAEFSELPDELRHKIKFEVYQVSSSLLGSLPASSPDFSVTISMPELAGKRITLSYIPASEDDATLIEEYGGITNVPAYLVEMKPVLRVEGEAVAVGNPVTLGESQQLVMEFISPGGEKDRVVNDVTAGAYYAVGLDLGNVPERLVEEAIAKLKTVRYLIGKSNVSVDSIIGEHLYAVASAYFLELDAFNRLLASHLGVAYFRQPSEAMVSTALSVGYLFWSPYLVDISGYTIDVDRDVYSVFSAHGEESRATSFLRSSGTIGSAMEHYILEQSFNISSVSAVKLISIANEQGIPVYEINQQNIDQILPRLQISQEVKDAIKSAVAQGKEVTVPEREVQYYNWSGVGWIVVDPKTGAGAYMISGGLAGGSTAEKDKMKEEMLFLDTLYTLASKNFDPNVPEVYILGVVLDIAMQKIVEDGLNRHIERLYNILVWVIEKLEQLYGEGKIGSLEFSYFMMVAGIAQMFLEGAESFQLGFIGLLVRAAFYRAAMEITFFLRDLLKGYKGKGV